MTIQDEYAFCASVTKMFSLKTFFVQILIVLHSFGIISKWNTTKFIVSFRLQPE